MSLELARILARSKPYATIVFAAVSAEEQGLYGSNFLAESYRNSSTNVAAMFTNDIIGSSTGQAGERNPFTVRLFAQGPPLTENNSTAATRLSTGGENDSPARELGRFAREVASNEATGMRVEVVYRLDRYLRGGDHRPFLEHGYAAARFTEPVEDYRHQHQDVRVEGGVQYGDLLEFVDVEYVARVAKVNMATLFSLAMAPAQPSNVRINATVLSNDSVFYWEKARGAAGYEIVWRPTAAPYWTDVVSVGDVQTATVSVSKDNVVFGVRSVGAEGYKSPAVFPFPAS